MNLQKQPRIVNKKWTDAAKGQPCTFNFPMYCNYDTETTVPCHLPSEDKGVGYKSSDIYACDGCYQCHAIIDGRNKEGAEYFKKDMDWYMLRALQRTLRNRHQRGIKFC